MLPAALLAALALAGDPAQPTGALLNLDGAQALVALDVPADLHPGGEVAVYAAESRPDPRGGPPLEGLRYAGDARVTWVGDGLVEIVLVSPDGLRLDAPIVLGAPRGLSPTPVFQPTPPEVVADHPDPAPATRAPLPTIHDDRRLPPGQSLTLAGGFAGDGYDSGAATGAMTWSLRPARGPARVSVGLEGLRGSRWVESVGDEPDALEPAAGYWIWSRVEAPWLGLAPFGGPGAGVEAEGLGLAWELGLRSGHPDRSWAAMSWRRYGEVGSRWTLEGRVALSDALAVGPRARWSELPRHDGDLQQARADGALVLRLDPSPRLGLTLAGGLGGYDLLIRDAGPVLDGALELRW